MLMPMPASEISRARKLSASKGMFFGLTYPRGEQPWTPISRLYRVDGDHVRNLLTAARAAVGGGEGRVAASLVFQGVVSRLVSPMLACVMLHGCLPRVPVSRMYFRPGDGELVTLAAEETDGYTGPVLELMDELVSTVCDDHVAPLTQALLAQVSISSKLLRGNTAAALVSGMRLLSQHSGHDWRELADHALRHPRLEGAGWLQRKEPGFVRYSCCLYYRVPNGGLCGDCSLTHNPLAGR